MCAVNCDVHFTSFANVYKMFQRLSHIRAWLVVRLCIGVDVSDSCGSGCGTNGRMAWFTRTNVNHGACYYNIFVQILR